MLYYNEYYEQGFREKITMYNGKTGEKGLYLKRVIYKDLLKWKEVMERKDRLNES